MRTASKLFETSCNKQNIPKSRCQNSDKILTLKTKNNPYGLKCKNIATGETSQAITS